MQSHAISKRDSLAVLLLSVFILVCFLTLAGTSQALAASSFGGGSANTEIDIKDPMTATARFQPSAVEAGGTVELSVALTLTKGFHAYADRFKITIESPDDLKIDQYRVAPLTSFKDAVSKSMKDGVENSATLKATIEVPSGYKAGQYLPQIKIVYQACTPAFCLFPKTLSLKVPLEVSGAAQAAAPTSGKAAEAAPPSSDASTIQLKAALDKGLFSALILMFIVGFLTSLTPCIYPMIPITLAVLGVRAPHKGEKPSHWRSVSISIVYVLGLAVTYSTLGVVAASTGGLFGSALSNIWVVSVIAVLFVAMGLGMFGLFEVQAPAFIRNRIGNSPAKGGYVGAFATGLVAGVIASPCIGPVLVSVLAFIAQTQNQLLGFMLLFSFALGMGLLFIILGVSGSLLARLPRAGSWMEIVKYFFGTIMIAMAFYYIQPLYPKWLFLSLLGVAGAMLGSFYGAFDPLTNFNGSARLKKGGMIILFTVGVALLVGGVAQKLGLVSSTALQAATPVATANSPLPIFKPYSDAAFEEAKKSGKPIMLDFMAEWCGACKELEAQTYPVPEVSGLMNQFTMFKIDATESTDEISRITTKFGIIGLPTLMFYNAKGEAKPDLSLTGFEDAPGFAKRLKSAME